MSINKALWQYFVGDSSVTDLVDLRVYNGFSPGYATGLLTFTGQPLDTETVVIDGKTYTFQTALEDDDGNVFIGATTDDSIDNLVAAINRDDGSGTQYAASMTRHRNIDANRPETLKMEVSAERVSKSSLATTETLTNGSWGQATMNVFPVVVLNQVTIAHASSMDGGAGLAQAQYQIDCVGLTSPSAEAVRDAIFELTHGFDGAIGTPSVTVESMIAATGNDLPDPPETNDEVVQFRKILNVSIWHRESIPSFA